MKSNDHMLKAERIENSLGKLDADSDYEAVVELCMLIGTHYLNALAHEAHLVDEAEDLLHSDKPALEVPIPSDLATAFEAMKYIEDLRPPYIRGCEPIRAAIGRESIVRVEEVKNITYDLIRSTRAKMS